MPFPTSGKRWGGNLADHGIQVGVFPSTEGRLGIELQSATANSTASSVWQSIYLPPTSASRQLLQTYRIPMSTRRTYFRARHIGQGYANGPFTATVSAKPTTLATFQPPIPALNAAANWEVPGANVLISSGNLPKVGSQNTTSYVTQTIRFPGAAYELVNSSGKFSHTNHTELIPNTTVAAQSYTAQFPLSVGVTLTGIKVAYVRLKAASTATFSFYKGRSTGATPAYTLLKTLTGTTGAVYQTISTTTVSMLVDQYTLLVGDATLKSTAGAAALLAWVELTYRRPTYAAVY